ncbi:MAG: S49 family peptidase [Verrucomicrobiales bacterium]|jgi:signal peptide peptidase SppA|nr:S49 family peptidase [Verrucomicrobiales bacterium]
MKTTLFDRPWLLTQEYHAQLAARAAVWQGRTQTEFSPFAAPVPQTVKKGDVAVINVSGVLMKRPGKFESWCGATDLDAVADELFAADHDPAVAAVLVHFDSPGGSVTGIPELAARLADLSKFAIAYTDTLCASAAYWLASQCGAVLAAPSAIVGGVGVFVPVRDCRAAYASMGISVEIIKSGQYKGAGVPGTSLTDGQRQLLQDEVNAIHSQFKAAVRERRAAVTDADMEGQTFRGADAAARGLVTGLAADLDAAVEKVRAWLPR